MLTFTQNTVYKTREAKLRLISKGASGARVLEILGAPTEKRDDCWYYEATLVGSWRYDFRTDDMLVIFEDGKVEDAWMTPK